MVDFSIPFSVHILFFCFTFIYRVYKLVICQTIYLFIFFVTNVNLHFYLLHWNWFFSLLWFCFVSLFVYHRFAVIPCSIYTRTLSSNEPFQLFWMGAVKIFSMVRTLHTQILIIERIYGTLYSSVCGIVCIEYLVSVYTATLSLRILFSYTVLFTWWLWLLMLLLLQHCWLCLESTFCFLDIS